MVLHILLLWDSSGLFGVEKGPQPAPVVIPAGVVGGEGGIALLGLAALPDLPVD